MRCGLRMCAQLSAIGAAVLPFAARGAPATCTPLAKLHPFCSIRLSNPFFQSPVKWNSAAAAEPESSEGGSALNSSDIVAVYVTVPDIEQGMLRFMVLWPGRKDSSSVALAVPRGSYQLFHTWDATQCSQLLVSVVLEACCREANCPPLGEGEASSLLQHHPRCVQLLSFTWIVL